MSTLNREPRHPKGWLQVIASARLNIAALVVLSMGGLVVQALPASASTSLNGTGSTFAAPAISQWNADVSHAPYSLTINYSPSSSGTGRFEFTNETTDFAVSDVGYVNASTGSTPPSFPFDFIPVTAAGVAFMYNIPGLTAPLQLTSYTACLVLTGQVTNWNDPVFQQNGANSGVTLPNVQIVPVTEEDPAGTNYVLEEYCIDEQPSVWAQYAKNVAGTTAEGVSIVANAPGSNWVPPTNGVNQSSTSGVASTVSGTPGAMGAVQENYATDSGFTDASASNGRSVALVSNASGDFTKPSPVNVASALAYATQNADGTHKLNFDGAGPNVYNPSTYSYLLTPTTGWSATKGVVLSNYVNYVLTLGQKKAPSMDFASLGLSLERYGIDHIISDVPGAVSPTSAESQAYSCGDLTPAEVQAGQTTPTCGVTNGAAPPAPPGAPSVSTSAATTASATTTTIAKKATAKSTTTTKAKTASSVKSPAGAATTTTLATSTGSDTPGVGSSAATASSSGGDSASVSLGQTSPLAQTGFDPLPPLIAGLILLSAGWLGRRRILRSMRETT